MPGSRSSSPCTLSALPQSTPTLLQPPLALPPSSSSSFPPPHLLRRRLPCLLCRLLCLAKTPLLSLQSRAESNVRQPQTRIPLKPTALVPSIAEVLEYLFYQMILLSPPPLSSPLPCFLISLPPIIMLPSLSHPPRLSPCHGASMPMCVCVCVCVCVWAGVVSLCVRVVTIHTHTR